MGSLPDVLSVVIRASCISAWPLGPCFVGELVDVRTESVLASEL